MGVLGGGYLSQLYHTLPMDVLGMVYGLTMCFFGGFFHVTIAAIEVCPTVSLDTHSQRTGGGGEKGDSFQMSPDRRSLFSRVRDETSRWTAVDE